jgi:hypothetical protein
VKVRLVLGLVIATTLAASALGSPASAAGVADRQLCLVTSDDPTHRDAQTICISW